MIYAFLYPEVTEKICRVPYPLLIFTPLYLHASTFFGLSTNGSLLVNVFPENLLLNNKLTQLWILFFVDFKIYLLNVTSPIFINVHRWNKSSNNFAKYNITR